jgi:ABC-type multidrug transport system permease subunit
MTEYFRASAFSSKQAWSWFNRLLSFACGFASAYSNKNRWRFIMQISGITYVKRKKKWIPKFLLVILIILVALFVVVLGLLMFTDVTIPYISEWLNM